MIRNLKELGINIKTRRAALEMSQGELAFQLGTDKAYISRIERGEINIGIVFLTEICVVLKTTPNRLLDIASDMFITHSVSRSVKRN